MTRMASCLMAGVVLAICGCASMPTREQLAKGDYGPFPENYRKDVEGYLQATLKDPESAKTNLDSNDSHPAQFAFGSRWRGGVIGEVHHGWCADVQVNGKNSYGGYVGYQSYIFCWENGTITQAGPMSEVVGLTSFYMPVTTDGNALSRDAQGASVGKAAKMTGVAP